MRIFTLDSLHRIWLQKSNNYRFDFLNPACMLLLAIIGVFFIYSAQVYTGRSQYIMQIVWMGIGAFVYLAVSLTDYRFFLKNSHLVWFGAILLLVLLWSPLGESRFGARRWIDLRFFSFQPSETAKLGCVIVTASILARSEIGTFRQSLRVLIQIAAMIGLPMLLIFAQPDLGSALVIPPMIFALLYVSDLSQRFFAVAFGGL